MHTCAKNEQLKGLACDESALANLSHKVAAAIQAPGNPDSLQFLRTVLNDYRYYALNEVCLC